MIKVIDARIDRALARRRLAFRGKITRVNADAPVQLVQIDGVADEQLQDNELMQHYGYTSNPPAGTMGVVLPVGGRTAHGIVVATEHGTYRLKALKPGEVAVYTDEGDSIVLKRGRLIEVTTQTLKINASTKVEITTPDMVVTAANQVLMTTPLVKASAVVTADGKINGNGGMAIQGGTGATFSGNVAQTGGSITTDGDVQASGKSLAGHAHGGVQPGSGNTGTPI
jgi:phage baseplate assembly protein V